MKYRPEIDGLRALAVIPVILFHAGLESFSGGYVGVDVFFVISGFLITTIILSEKEQGTFSLVNFYERRARRILPALFLVMLACLPAAWLWLTPLDMEDFSKSLAAVSIFSSNILFWHESGYWEVASELKPLLHTWSLAVEEQYYVLFPLFLMAMWRFRKRWIFGSFMVIAAVSLLAAQWGSYRHPEATFFLLPTRAWELAIGAGIAFYFLYRPQAIHTLPFRKPYNEVLGLLGLLMIAWSVFAFDESVPFPGFYALLPTVGTGLIILFSSPQTLAGRLLGTRLLVGVGLISYSAYLWHYPLIAFSRHRSLTEPGEVLLLALALLSFPLAWLSWRYVERPFRQKDVTSRKTIFIFSLAGSLFFMAIGLAGDLNKGWPGRMDEQFAGLMPGKAKNPECEAKTFQPGKQCELVPGTEGLTFLIGDSHAGSISRELQKAFAERGIGLWGIVNTACPPVRGVYRADGGNVSDFSCYEFNEALFRFIEESEEIETVIMMGRWTLSMEGVRFDNREGGVETSRDKPHLDLVVDGRPQYHPDYEHREALSEKYSDSVTELVEMGKRVILVYPVPEAGWSVPNYLVRYLMNTPGQELPPGAGSTSYAVFKERNRRSYAALDRAGQHPGLYRVYPEKVLCDRDVKDRCIVQKDGNALYADDNHLSSAGARRVVDEIVELLE
ncbi:MAG: acyltransferase family protein [Xanthomonadales bacterium]|jgi:peptidoglycan/LPS O-acetylase OafA/YrhL|nr:acyltransferase family protein [Xanthomonadales bacterium]